MNLPENECLKYSFNDFLKQITFKKNDLPVEDLGDFAFYFVVEWLKNSYSSLNEKIYTENDFKKVIELISPQKMGTITLFVEGRVAKISCLIILIQKK